MRNPFRAVRPADSRWICFERARPIPPGASSAEVHLSCAHAQALAELLQVLACGEESAALAFDHLAESCAEQAMRAALVGIAAEEDEHRLLLDRLMQSLPRPPPDPAIRTLMRRFFMRLADRDVRVHCVRIFAIDSAVCQLLGALRRRHSPLVTDRTIEPVLRRIHRDEARHVVIAKRCAGSLLETTRGREIAAEARHSLQQVLATRASALDALGVNPERLFAQLRDIPRSVAPC